VIFLFFIVILFGLCISREFHCSGGSNKIFSGRRAREKEEALIGSFFRFVDAGIV